MKYLEYKPEGSISNPVDSANNSNTYQQIEVIEVMDNTIKKPKKVRILRDPSKYLNPILDNLTDDILYSDEVDTKGVPLLNKIEKYNKDLPVDVFIRGIYITFNGDFKNIENTYVNKLGEAININSNTLLKSQNDKDGYNRFTSIPRVCRLVASTFLINPKPTIYKVVNHIDHIRVNDNLNNLNWVTPTKNADKQNGYCSKISEEKLMEYIAINKEGEEIFRINKNNNTHDGIVYNVLALTSKISDGNGKGFYKGYFWKRSRKSKKEELLDLIGYSGNIKDYIWYTHPLYSGVSVCKEGFIKCGEKILGTLSKSNYVNVTIGKGHGVKYRANRLIMEFLEGRYLRSDEIVDHINTNTLDNSFENLRIVDTKGNNLNKNTLIKRSTLLVVADLFGDFLYCGFSKDCGKFMGIKEKDDRSYRIDTLNNIKITNNKFICITPGNLELLKEKMKSVFYVFKDNKPIDASKTLKLLSKKYKYSVSGLQYSLRENKILSSNIIIKKGKDAVNEVISSGHGTAFSYIPELNQFGEKPNIIDYSKYKKYLEKTK